MAPYSRELIASELYLSVGGTIDRVFILCFFLFPFGLFCFVVESSLVLHAVVYYFVASRRVTLLFLTMEFDILHLQAPLIILCKLHPE